MKNYLIIVSFAFFVSILAGCTLEGDISNDEDFVAPIGYFKNLDFNGDKVKIRVKNVHNEWQETTITLEIKPKFLTTSTTFKTNLDEYLYLYDTDETLYIEKFYINGEKKTSKYTLNDISEKFTIDMVFPRVPDSVKYVDLVMPAYELKIEKMAVH